MFLRHTAPDQAPLLAAAAIAACRLPGGWTTPLQPRMLEVLFAHLLGLDLDLEQLEPALPIQLALALPDPGQRQELIELLVTLELLCDPIPEALQASIEHWAAVLEVESDALRLTRDLCNRAASLATADFYRLSWIGELAREDPDLPRLLQRYGTPAFALTLEPDPAEAARWRGLQQCPAGSLGRAMWDFYDERGFQPPGEVGAVSPALARHDWVHVITGYGTTPLGELQVAGFDAAASDSRPAFLNFLGAVSLYETGLLHSLVVKQPGHGVLSAAGSPEQLAEAIRLGRLCPVDPLHEVEYFAIADQPLAAIRRAWGLAEL
ncbi:MAG: hypothetical protein VKK62_02375 [Synechococcaceae cyanobacterium]|nr:hypothetical protein [Synechococcaceae cyanobacterium]